MATRSSMCGYFKMLPISCVVYRNIWSLENRNFKENLLALSKDVYISPHAWVFCQFSKHPTKCTHVTLLPVFVVVGFIIYICAIGAFHYLRCEFESLCDNVCQWLATGRWFSVGTPISFVNKTDLTEILLKVALNTITPTPCGIEV